MSSIKGLSLPEGTQVRMTCDYGGFTKGQIVTRSYTKRDDSDTVYFVDYNTDDYGNHLSDYQWELIEEPKEEKPATRGLALPNGTKVRMTCDYGGFTKGQIVTRSYAKHDDSDTVYFVDYNADEYEYLPDDQWELIEEPKEEPRLPKQGDAVEVRDISWDEDDWDAEPYSFVCFYKNKVLIEYKDGDFRLYDQWRFPTQEEVTLSDGKTYLVEERDGEKILKLKQ